MDLSTTFASIRKQVAGLSLVALVAGLFAAGVATAATENIFSDVPADAWYAGYVNDLAVAGVIDSTKDMYRPGDLVNRAEMAKFAFMVSGLPMETASAAPYKDVAMGQWYTDYIYTLTKNGIVSGDKANGVPTGYFRPEASLNRAEAAKMLVNAAAMAEDITGNPHFPDVASGAWYFNFVETAFNNGVVSGYPDGNYRPSNNINRAEAAKMVYLSMNPVAAGFTLDSAAAASKTTVELIFSMNVDSTLASDEANYLIEDSSGTKLAVSAAEVTAADTVMLTTSTQTEGKVYYVTPKNLESDAGDALANTDSVSFLGYGADVSGGALEVALSTQTPVAGSIPSGATGVVFTCWDFMAGSSDVTVKSVHVHRVGPGSQGDFDNVYLYNGDQRLTTGRTISSETQLVEFNNINQEVAAGDNMKLCVVADLKAGATGGVHAFELDSADSVMSNSSNMTGSFPLRGAEQLITSAAVGKSYIRRNGTLNEATIGEKGVRIAQFEIEADGSEDQQLERVALYVRGSISTGAISNMQLFVEGDSAALAATDAVGAKELATFSLDKPFKIGRGMRKIFYVTGDLNPGKNGDTIKIYLDEATDLNVTGSTYGYGTRVDSTKYDGGDGADLLVNTSDDEYSYVTIKGSDFVANWTGPSASNIPVGQKAVSCLDLTLTNSSGEDLEIKDWEVDVAVAPIVVAADGGLYNATGATPNYTLFKLARINEDGTLGGSLLGPNELPNTTDALQTVKLGGSANITAGETIKAAVVFDIANNTLMNGDKVTCTLKALNTSGKDYIRDINGDALTSSSITPSSDIVGNPLKVVDAALKVKVASTPASQTVVKGVSDVSLLGISLESGVLDSTLKTISIASAIDTAPAAVPAGDADVLLTQRVESGKATKDVVTNLKLYDGATQVGTVESINDSTGKVTFNNLSVSIPKGTTKLLILKGNISNSTYTDTLIKFGVVANTDITALDNNSQTISGISTVNAENGLNAGANLIPSTTGTTITIKDAGTVNVASTSQYTSKLIGGGVTAEKIGNIKFNMTNAPATLDDFVLSVLGEPAGLQTVYLFDSSCSTARGSATGYSVTGGTVTVTDAAIALPIGQTTLCIKGDFAPVSSTLVDPPVSGKFVAIALTEVNQITSGGSDINGNFATLAGTETVGMTAVATNPTLSGAVVAGDVIKIDEELMYVSSIGPVVVIRGFAGTAANAHSAGAAYQVLTSGTTKLFELNTATYNRGTVLSDGTNYIMCLNPVCAVAATDQLIISGVTFNPAATALDVKFNQAGEAFKLRKAAPTLALSNTIVGGNTLATSTQFPVAAFSITATGVGAVEFQPTDALNFTVGTGTTVNTCALYGPGDQKLSTDDATPATIAFDNVSAWSISAGETKVLTVKCDLTTVGGDDFQMTLDSFSYSDGVVANITGDTSLIVNTLPIAGPTFTRPT